MNQLTPLAQIKPTQIAAPARASGGAVATSATLSLTRKQKAAIVVRFLLNEGAEVPLAELPEGMQSDLTQQMGEMRYIDRDTLAQVVGEFADELEAMGLTFPRGLAGALTALDGKISPITAARLRKEAGVRAIGDPWEMIQALPLPALVPIIETEATEVAAVLLSKLPVDKAAELLGLLPGARARRITYAISLTGGVTPDAVDRIGLSLASQFETQPIRAFDEGADERVGAILNFSPAITRDDVLVGLDEADAEFAVKVRRAIFTFAHIPARLSTVDIPKITRDVDQSVLVTALAYATNSGDEELAAAATYILENLSKRMSESLSEEIAESSAVKTRDGEDAMNAVIGAIRALQAAGDIELVVSEEDAEGEDG